MSRWELEKHKSFDKDEGMKAIGDDPITCDLGKTYHTSPPCFRSIDIFNLLLINLTRYTLYNSSLPGLSLLSHRRGAALSSETRYVETRPASVYSGA